MCSERYLPVLNVLQSLDQDVKVNSLGRIEIVLIPERSRRFLWRQWLIERVLSLSVCARDHAKRLLRTIERITTHGRFSEATIAIARDVFPEPELPATPMMLALPHGGW
jgi:hypothetical protein